MADVPLPDQVISRVLRAWNGRYTQSPIETLVRIVPAVLYTGLIFRLSSTEPDDFPGIAIDDRIAHFTAYAVLGVFLMLMLAAVTWLQDRPIFRVVLSIAIAASVGMLDEWNQSFIPGRDSSWKDVGFDVLGAAFSSLMIAMLLRMQFRSDGDHVSQGSAAS